MLTSNQSWSTDPTRLRTKPRLEKSPRGDRLQAGPHLMLTLLTGVTSATGNQDLALSSCVAPSLFLTLSPQTRFLCQSRFSSTLLSWSQELLFSNKEEPPGLALIFSFFSPHTTEKKHHLPEGK